jgi:hypothetical protein
VAAGNGFNATERHQVDRAIRAAEQSCRFEFSVFVGAADGESAPFAHRLHGALVAPDRSILIMVDPSARLLEVVTGSQVRRHLSDRAVELSVLQMESAFAADELVGGLTRGISMLAEHARPQNTLHAG